MGLAEATTVRRGSNVVVAITSFVGTFWKQQIIIRCQAARSSGRIVYPTKCSVGKSVGQFAMESSGADDDCAIDHGVCVPYRIVSTIL